MAYTDNGFALTFIPMQDENIKWEDVFTGEFNVQLSVFRNGVCQFVCVAQYNPQVPADRNWLKRFAKSTFADEGFEPARNEVIAMNKMIVSPEAGKMTEIAFSR